MVLLNYFYIFILYILIFILYVWFLFTVYFVTQRLTSDVVLALQLMNFLTSLRRRQHHLSPEDAEKCKIVLKDTAFLSS